MMKRSYRKPSSICNNIARIRIVICIVAVLSVMLAACSGRSPVDKNGKFRQKVTLEQVKEVQSEAGDPTWFRIGGGAGYPPPGEYYAETLTHNDDGVLIYRVVDCPNNEEPYSVKEYKANDDAMEVMKAVVDNYNFGVWDRLPQQENAAEIYDGYSDYIIVGFSNESGEEKIFSLNSNTTIVIPKGAENWYQDFCSAMRRTKIDECLDSYMVDVDGNRME